MGDFHMNRTYNKEARLKIAKKVSNFENRAENFYSDKTAHFYNMGFHAIYSRESDFIHNTEPYRSVPYRTVPYRTVPYRTVPYRTLPFSVTIFITLAAS
jgi:hypothetical protein